MDNFWQQVLIKILINTATFNYFLGNSLYLTTSCSHSSLEVEGYLFLSLKGWQSSILWSVLCRFHWLYHCCHSLSLIAICCHSLSLDLLLVITLWQLLHHLLSLVVIRCHLLCHLSSFVVTRCTTRCDSLSLVVTRCHSLSLVFTRCTTCLSFYKRSFHLIESMDCVFYA